MVNSEQIDVDGEAERLRKALDQEERRHREIQSRLARANAEFEEFVSMAAHNLRQSLRDVTAFSQLLAETQTGRLDSEGIAFVQRIQNGAGEMQSLLTDMVDYWATGSGEPPVARTDMQAVLFQALLNLDRQIAGRSAVLTHDLLPTVSGDFAVLTRVMHHLIRNAIEYCTSAPPRVHISSRRVNAEWVFSVKDNGPGIEPALQSRIFGVFKRLHGKEHPGHGLGLALCKRAIEWHGGRIWLESTPGEGSTFYFVLPDAD
ncbi:MAG TPA: ATP-binding protein [Bryobacteraceae bacterium]|nr:ATP-binding protein [Bryobacteraceae bacterium]